MLPKTPPSPPAPRFPQRDLRSFEKLTVPLLHAINANRHVKQALHPFMYWFVHGWVGFITRNLWELHGTEHVIGLDPPRGLVLVSNHRSFFDMYIASAVLYDIEPSFMQRIFFPVRKNFFYDDPVGLLVNLSISGASMWPPVFRDDRKGGLNAIGLDQVASVLTKGAVVGLHPEGKRGQGDDPWTMLPAKPGLGRLLKVCHPETLVLPFFTLGLSNSAKRLITRNFAQPGQKGEPIRLRFAAPRVAGELIQAGDDLAITQAVMDVIDKLGAEDRAARTADPRIL